MSDWRYSVVELVVEDLPLNRPALHEGDIDVGTYLQCGYEILAVWSEPTFLWFLGKSRRMMLVRKKVN